jgi:hypothetical protein
MYNHFDFYKLNVSRIFSYLMNLFTVIDSLCLGVLFWIRKLFLLVSRAESNGSSNILLNLNYRIFCEILQMFLLNPLVIQQLCFIFPPSVLTWLFVIWMNSKDDFLLFPTCLNPIKSSIIQYFPKRFILIIHWWNIYYFDMKFSYFHKEHQSFKPAQILILLLNLKT